MLRDIIEVLEIIVEIMENSDLNSVSDPCYVYDAYRSFCDFRRKAHHVIINCIPLYLEEKDFSTGHIEQEMSKSNVNMYNDLLHDLTVRKHTAFEKSFPFGWVNFSNYFNQRRGINSEIFRNNFVYDSLFGPLIPYGASKIDKNRHIVIYTFKLVRDATRDTARRTFHEKYSKSIIDLSTQENRDLFIIETKSELNTIDLLLKKFEQMMSSTYTIADIFVKNYNEEYRSLYSMYKKMN